MQWCRKRLYTPQRSIPGSECSRFLCTKWSCIAKNRISLVVPKRRHSNMFDAKITKVEVLDNIPFTVCHKNCRLGCGIRFHMDQVKQNVRRLHYNKTEFEKKHALLRQRKSPNGDDIGNTFMGQDPSFCFRKNFVWNKDRLDMSTHKTCWCKKEGARRGGESLKMLKKT